MFSDEESVSLKHFSSGRGCEGGTNRRQTVRVYRRIFIYPDVVVVLSTHDRIYKNREWGGELSR